MTWSEHCRILSLRTPHRLVWGASCFLTPLQCVGYSRRVELSESICTRWAWLSSEVSLSMPLMPQLLQLLQQLVLLPMAYSFAVISDNQACLTCIQISVRSPCECRFQRTGAGAGALAAIAACYWSSSSPPIDVIWAMAIAWICLEHKKEDYRNCSSVLTSVLGPAGLSF